MKALKTILIYLAFILGILLVIALSIIAFMYFSPGSSVFGFKYVRCDNKLEYIYNNTTELSVENVEAIEITVNNSDIYIYPNKESSDLKIAHIQQFSGFCKAVNSTLSVNNEVVYKQFEEDNSELKTFRTVVKEPTGWINKNNSSVAVYVPSSLLIDTIYLKSTGGNIYYVSADETSLLNCNDLYLKTSNKGNISIQNEEPISNYYLQTQYGNVNFTNASLLEASQIKFDTYSGAFSYVNATGNATIQLSKALTINSADNKSGPRIYINKLNADFYVNSNKGIFSINEISTAGVYRTIAMTLNQAEINFGKVYGVVSLYSADGKLHNKVNISQLIYPNATHILEVGEGNVNINYLSGNIAIDATEGNINISEVTTSSDVYAFTTSGNIYVKYVESEEESKDTYLKVITETGNVNLHNISVSLDIKVLKNSSNKEMNLFFTAVTGVDNKIFVRDRVVNLSILGLSDSLQFRIVSTSKVDLVGAIAGTEVSTEFDSNNVRNNDYLLGLNAYNSYSYGYRIGYIKDLNPGSNYSTNAFESWGKLLIQSSNYISITAKNQILN